MRKADQLRDRKNSTPCRGSKDAPPKVRISRDYGRGLINDHIRDDFRDKKYLHAHARRRRAATQEKPNAH